MRTKVGRALKKQEVTCLNTQKWQKRKEGKNKEE